MLPAVVVSCWCSQAWEIILLHSSMLALVLFQGFSHFFWQPADEPNHRTLQFYENNFLRCMDSQILLQTQVVYFLCLPEKVKYLAVPQENMQPFS